MQLSWHQFMLRPLAKLSSSSPSAHRHGLRWMLLLPAPLSAELDAQRRMVVRGDACGDGENS